MHETNYCIFGSLHHHDPRLNYSYHPGVSCSVLAPYSDHNRHIFPLRVLLGLVKTASP
jgi:hypothetical protein